MSSYPCNRVYSLALGWRCQKFAEPLKQRDLKVAKRLRFGAPRAIGVDLFNALNSGAILSYNNTFNAIWLQPLTILTARMAKITAELTF